VGGGSQSKAKGLTLSICKARKVNARKTVHQKPMTDEEMAVRIKAAKPLTLRYFVVTDIGDSYGLRFDIEVGGGIESVAVHVKTPTMATEYAKDMRAAAEYMERWVASIAKPVSATVPR
jgi:hypothetical protein